VLSPYGGDAKGVMQAVVHRKARHARINLLIAEMCLLLGQGMHDLVASHWWSEKNVMADDLSRITEGIQLPKVFEGLERAMPSRSDWQLLSL